MIEKALRYLNSLTIPNIREINGQTYTDKPLTRVKYNPKAEPLHLTTLGSLLDYISSGLDDLGSRQLIIHIQSPTHVEVFSALDNERDRETLVIVDANIPQIVFGSYIDHESFCVALQSKFVDDPETDRALILKFAGTVEAGSVAEYGDDGVSQKAVVKTGIASKDAALVPSPARLMPYRTFLEVPQPASSFIFRMKQDKYDVIQCALFEADGGAWKLSAMQLIKEYLSEELADYPNFTIIS